MQQHLLRPAVHLKLAPLLPGGCLLSCSYPSLQSLYILYITLYIHVIISCISTRAPLRVYLYARTSRVHPRVHHTNLVCTSTRAPYLACTSTHAPHLACTSRASFALMHPSSPSAIKMDLDHSVSHCYILAISLLYFSFINSFWPSALSHNHC